jgi:branched-chain amino acid transport system substrate-binding protein
MKTQIIATALASCLLAFSAQAQVKIGLIATLTGPLGGIGQDQVDGFMLGLEQRGNQLGGQKVEIIREDDQAKPEVGAQIVQRLVEREKVNLIVGVTASNVINAVFPRIVEAGVPFVGTNGGPSPFAGERCSPLFVSTAFQNDGPHEAMGQYAQNRGYKKVLVMAPNYQAGKDAIAGFKRFYKGTVVDEIYPGLGQADFAAELAQVRGEKPDAVFAFFPGGMGINFVKQYQQAGLLKDMPLLSAFTVDDLTLPAIKDAAVGLVTAAHWTSGTDRPSSKAFVAAFEQKYRRTPSNYAAQGYDAASLIDQGIVRAGADWTKPAALAQAMRSAKLDSVRGEISFGPNGFPLQDYRAWKVVKQAGNKLVFQLEDTVLRAHRDAYVASCKL